MNNRTPTKEEMVDMYINKEMSMKNISIALGISVGKIHKLIGLYGIESRHAPYKNTIIRAREANIGNTHRRGKYCSEEAKEKMRLIHLGKYTNPSEYGGHEKVRHDGYISVYCPNHPKATKDGHVMKHRLVMEEHIGRYLNDDEVVHHKNKNRADNRLENLELMTSKEHARHHMMERLNTQKGVLTY